MSTSSGPRGSWNPLPCSGPVPKACINHSSVVTNKSTLMVLGGEPSSNSTPVAELFLYKSRKWGPAKRHNAPPGLASHASVSWGAKAVTFGGRSASGLSNEMYTYNEETSSWSRARQNGDIPPPREGHSMNIVPLRMPDGALTNADQYAQALVVFGGITAEGSDDAIYFMPLDTVDLRWRKLSTELSSPPSRSYHSSSVVGSKIYIFGGKSCDGSVLDDMWCLDFSAEAPASSQIEKSEVWPAARFHHASTSIHSHLSFSMVGGKSSTDAAPDDLIWVYQTHSQSWLSFPLEITPRFGHTLSNLHATKVCIIGGMEIIEEASSSANSSTSANSSFNAVMRVLPLPTLSRGDSAETLGPIDDSASTKASSRKRKDSLRASQQGERRGSARKGKNRQVEEPTVSAPAPAPEAPNTTKNSTESTVSAEPISIPVEIQPTEDTTSETVMTTTESESAKDDTSTTSDHTTQENSMEEVPMEPEVTRSESPPPPPPEEAQDSILAANIAQVHEENVDSAVPAIEVKPSTPEVLSPATSKLEIASPVSTFKKAHVGGRVRSSRISLSDGIRGGWNFAASPGQDSSAPASPNAASAPSKPGNPEWIDHMDEEQLKTELKIMVAFVYSAKAVVDTPGQSAESQLASIKAHFSDFLPQFIPPPFIKQQLAQQQQQQPASTGSALPPSSPPPSISSSVSASNLSISTAAPAVSPLARGASTDQLSSSTLAAVSAAATIASSIVSPVPSTNPGSGRLTWGASSPLALSGGSNGGSSSNTSSTANSRETISQSSSFRDSIMLSSSPTIGGGHRGSMLLSLSGNSIAAALSSSPPTSFIGNGMSPSSSAGSGLDSSGAPRAVKAFDSSSTAEKQAQMLEAQMEATIPTTSCPDNDQTRKERQFVVKELLETERNYVRDLKLIVDEFQEPLSTSGILNPKQVFEVFSTVKAFVPLHEQLLDNLSATIEKPDAEQSPGQIFLAMADYLKMYTQFCASQSGIAQKISDISKANSAFRKFLDQKFKDPKCRGLTLTSFLVMPIQRVCRFPLLLKQIAKSTPVTHTDFKNLHFAIFKVDKVVMAVNEGKRAIEAQLQIYEMDQTIVWEKKPPANFVFMDPSRRFIQQESIELIAGTTLKVEPMQLLLFNDLLMIARLKETGSATPATKKVRRAYALADTQIGLDDQLDLATGKANLQITFAGDSINVAFPSKDKRAEIQQLLAETKAKLPDSQGVRDTIQVLQNYLGAN